MESINAMKAIRATRIAAVVAAAALAAGLTGCPRPPGPDGSGSADLDRADGTRCRSDTVVAGPVYIDIAYSADGTPADPGSCLVDSGTDVTWRGPSGAPVKFEIHFKGTAPLDPGERGILPSARIGERQKVTRKVSGPTGEYKYGIKANDKELDPAIIIR